MKSITLLILALLGQVAFAQQAAFDGFWSCSLRSPDDPLRRCSAVCDGADRSWTVIPKGIDCPGSEFQTPGDSRGRCEALFAGMPPLCCPPGVPCSRDAPAPTETSSSGGGSSGTNKALIAGGVVVAAVALYNFVDPDLPDGLTLEPTANLAYRDGLPYTSATLSGEYGNWAFSATSANFGQGWSKPYAQVRWAWVF